MNCPYCKRYFKLKSKAIHHIRKTHTERLDVDKMTPAQALYYGSHGTLLGNCMCGCGRKTDWNEKTEKPSRVSTEPSCRLRLRKQALSNHVKTHGVETLLNDMDHQKKMQKNRPTAGDYKFSTGGFVGYLSSLELNFLEFCDNVLDFTYNMIQESPEVFRYYDPKSKTNRQYIPDYYLPDYNLLVEIKDGGDNPNTNPAFIEETKYKVALKDAAMRKQGKYNFIKITDSNYGPFVELLYQIVSNDPISDRNNLIVLGESAQPVPYEYNVEDETFNSLYLIVVHSARNYSYVKMIGLTSSLPLIRMYGNKDGILINEILPTDPLFDDSIITIYKYVVDDPETITRIMRYVINAATMNDTKYELEVLRVLKDNGIMFTDNKRRLSNDVGTGKNRMDFVVYGIGGK